jgi:hypothetical protein
VRQYQPDDSWRFSPGGQDRRVRARSGSTRDVHVPSAGVAERNSFGPLSDRHLVTLAQLREGFEPERNPFKALLSWSDGRV